jgi:hypothetical protein
LLMQLLHAHPDSAHLLKACLRFLGRLYYSGMLCYT